MAKKIVKKATKAVSKVTPKAPKVETCGNCAGRGRVSDTQSCGVCNGTGQAQ